MNTEQPKNTEIESKIIQQKDNQTTIQSESEIKKQTNLTVDDIELGLQLNQMNLECDSSIFTDTISYYDGMGPALYRLCKFDGALNFFNESLLKNPDDVEILVNKGSALGKLGFYTEAIVYYDQAIKINPNLLSAKNNKANALANLKDYDRAISLYREILKENPNYLSARKNLSVALSLQPSIALLMDSSMESHIQNTIYTESAFDENITEYDEQGKHTPNNPEQEKPTTFFDEIGIVLSTFGSLFGFFN